MSARVATSTDRASPGKRGDGRARATVRVHGAAALKPVASQRITLAGVRTCLERLSLAIEIPDEIAAGARRAVQRMLELGRTRAS